MEKAKLPPIATAVGIALTLLVLLNQHHQTKQLRALVSLRESQTASSATFPERSNLAEEAKRLGTDAEKVGNIDLAKIYYLSAVNHAPSDFPTLKSYADIVFREAPAKSDQLERLKSVLQVSLYQIPPASIPDALKLLEEVTQRESQLLADQTPKLQTQDLPKRLEQFTTDKLIESSWGDLNLVSRRIEALTETAESLTDEPHDPELTKKAESELDLAQRVLTAGRLTAAMDTIMTTLTSLNENPEKAISLLQTAESVLGQLWGVDSTRFPAALRSKIDQYPKEILNCVEKVAVLKSKPFLAQVEEARYSAKTYVDNKMWTASTLKGGPNQKVIDHCDVCLEKVLSAARQISSEDGRLKVDEATKEIRAISLTARRNQFDDYQKWVVSICADVFKQYENSNFTLAPSRILDPTSSNTLATQIFDASSLQQIDQGSLTSETSRLFNAVAGKITGKMNGTGQFEAEKKMAETAKKKPEDF